jgi:hypothetical protein
LQSLLILLSLRCRFRQKEAAIKAFDEKLEKLGYDGEHASKRSHHKDAADKKPE